jgi:hypothetical protein
VCLFVGESGAIKWGGDRRVRLSLDWDADRRGPGGRRRRGKYVEPTPTEKDLGEERKKKKRRTHDAGGE